ncbi:glycosyltransferase family 1 protein [Paenibacillaceae bacterium]|nr:glycosyltransferase family 1 protein [Paenibacillaceae bacterium]
MKVAIVMPLAHQRGGAEMLLQRLLYAELKYGNKVQYLLAFLEHGPMVEEARLLGYPVEVFDAGRLRQTGKYMMTVHRLVRWFVKERVQVVMSWMNKAHLYSGPAAVIARIPAVWWQHGFTSGRIDRWIESIPTKAVLCCSKAAAASLSKAAEYATVKVVYPAVDLQLFDQTSLPDKLTGRKLLGLPEHYCIIGMVARLQRWKGVHLFVEAAAAALAEQPRLLFVIVGGPHYSELDYEAELKEQADKLGIAANIVFAGHQTNVPEWMHACDILVHASDGEPFGMVIIEGMALGKAVIAANNGGPKEIVTDWQDGLLIDVHKKDDLSRAILTLSADAELRKRLGRAAVKRAASYSSERFAQEVAECLYEARGTIPDQKVGLHL